MVTQNGRNHGDDLAIIQHLQLSEMFIKKNSCCVFGEISLVSCRLLLSQYKYANG